MTSVELLERAAKVLRERAAELDENHTAWEPGADGNLAAYVALLRPPVALALAVWLEATAKTITEFADVAGLLRNGDLTGTDRAALAVARAILREGES